MKPSVLFLVGPPGVGKTTLVRELFDRLGERSTLYLVPKPKWTVVGGVCAAGHYVGETFDGADTVPYNGAADALKYWKRELAPEKSLTIFDGDRFSSGSSKQFVEAAFARGQVVCAHVTADAALLEERRKQRGSNQNPSWMKGRATKAQNFAGTFKRLLTLNGGSAPGELARAVISFLG